MTQTRWSAAARPALRHLLGVGALLLLGAMLLLRWYPQPFDELAHGRALWALLALGLLMSGPLLTFILYRTEKPRYQWRFDMALIAVLQLGVLVYGLWQLAQARPVVLGFEGDRVRLVQAGDLSAGQLDQAQLGLGQLGYDGPRWLGVQLLANTDPQYAKSVQQAMLGLHPALRPERWRPYASQQAQVQQALKPMAALRELHPGVGARIDQAVAATGAAEAELGFVPLMHGDDSDWVVLLRRSDATPLGYVPLTGWQVAP